MKRYIFRSIMKPNTSAEAFARSAEQNIREKCRTGKLFSLNLYRDGQNLYLYYEITEGDISPTELFDESNRMLVCWPGDEDERYWIRMADIYHANVPKDPEHWKRGSDNSRSGRLNRLQYDKLASYIFYHYQFQEERLGQSKMPRMIIGIHENLIFLQTEFPVGKMEPGAEPGLETHNTPMDSWQSLMNQHFMKWPEEISEQYWREIPILMTEEGVV